MRPIKIKAIGRVFLRSIHRLGRDANESCVGWVGLVQEVLWRSRKISCGWLSLCMSGLLVVPWLKEFLVTILRRDANESCVFGGSRKR